VLPVALATRLLAAPGGPINKHPSAPRSCIYDRRILERLAIVAFAKTCGFTLPEVRTLLSTSTGDAPLARRLGVVAKRKLGQLDSEAQAIACQKKRIQQALQCRCGDLGECGRRILARRSVNKGLRLR
jgi:hypothetical protein